MAIVRSYECADCTERIGKPFRFDKLHFSRDEPAPECPGCQAAASRQVPAGFAIGNSNLSKAVDITQDFSNPGKTYQIAKKLGVGGAGFYPVRHPFVHVDVGPVDTWVHPQHGRLDRAEEYDRMQKKTEKS